MSDDLISRKAAIDFIKDHSYPVRYDRNSIEQGMTITGIEQALNEVPTVQPVQKTGMRKNCVKVATLNRTLSRIFLLSFKLIKMYGNDKDVYQRKFKSSK